MKQLLPDPAFQTGSVAATSDMRHVGGTFLLGDMIGETGLRKDGFGTLLAYAYRRFGPPTIGGDSYKDICGSWMLKTPQPDIFIMLRPDLSGPEFSLGVFQRAGKGPPHKVNDADQPRILGAARAVLVDLLRPVNGRDVYFNALGLVDDRSPLMALADEDSGELAYAVDPAPMSTAGVPSGILESQALRGLLATARLLGGRDGLEHGLTLIQKNSREALVERLRQSESAARNLVYATLDALGCPMEEQCGLLARMGYSVWRDVLFGERDRTTGLPVGMDEESFVRQVKRLSEILPEDLREAQSLAMLLSDSLRSVDIASIIASQVDVAAKVDFLSSFRAARSGDGDPEASLPDELMQALSSERFWSREFGPPSRQDIVRMLREADQNETARWAQDWSEPVADAGTVNDRRFVMMMNLMAENIRNRSPSYSPRP